MIGIIGAMQEEITLLLEMMGDYISENIAGKDIYLGRIGARNVAVALCGIGKVNAAMLTQILISEYKCSAIINTGIAGAVDSAVNVADIVVAKDLVHHDMDTTVFGDALGQVPRLDVYAFPTDEKISSQIIEIAKKIAHPNSVYFERVVSGDQFIASSEKKKFLSEQFGAYACEMESTAIAQVCYLNKIKCVIVRTISDKADGSAEVDFAEFTKIAADLSAKIVFKALSSGV